MPSLFESMRNRPRPVVSRANLMERLRTTAAVQKATPERQSDMARILALPRRMPLDIKSQDAYDLARRITEKYKAPQVAPCDCEARGVICPNTLLPLQAWTLAEAEAYGGILGAIGVGHGKTLIDLLIANAISSKVVVLLIPPDLRASLDKEWARYALHGWRLPNRAGGRYFDASLPMLHVVAYSELSNPRTPTILENLRPDLIIADECQALRNRSAVGTGRFLRYMAEHTETKLCAWSGTLTKRSLKDFAHLAIFALRELAPVPLQWAAIDDWATFLDPSDIVSYVPASHALCKLVPDAEVISTFGVGSISVKKAREAFHRRLVETPGVIYTPGKSVDIPIIFRPRTPLVPEPVRDALEQLKKGWVRPDGEEFSQAVEAAACARHVACGFYYRWRFTHGETEELIKEWLKRRKAWHAELREKLKYARPYLDSPLLCANAAIRHYDGYKGPLPTWAARTWPGWKEIKDLVQPETEAVWIDDFLARDAAKWAKENTGIVWYLHDAFGRRVAQIGGLPLYGPGEKASSGILEEKGNRSIVASVNAHHKGKNLQAFKTQLVANPPSDGGIWEQLLGRMHRTGQKAGQIDVWVYRHVEEMVRAVDRASSLAEYIEDMLGTSQRLLQRSA